MFRNSMYSSMLSASEPNGGGAYMISLMTTGPTLGPALAAPRVLAALGDEMFDAVAGDIAAEGDAVDLRAELEPMPITGKVGAVAREEINLLAEGTKSEAVGAVVVELAFVEGDVAAGRDYRVGGDTVFSGLVVVVSEEPAADGCRAGGGIVELDGVGLEADRYGSGPR